MDYRILGPVGVWVDGAEVRVGGPRERRALAALLLSAGRAVSAARLVDVLWGDDPPSTATTQIRNTLAALRQSIAGSNGGSAPIERVAGGFVLRLDGAEFDLHAFERAVSRSGLLAERGELTDAVAALRQALRLWRGPALGGVATPALRAEADRLEEQRFSCLQRCIEIDVALGRHQEAAAELALLVHQYPLREHLTGLLMIALYRAGRRQDALDAFAAARVRLADEAGLDPGPRLVGLHRAILRDEPVADPIPVPPGSAAPTASPAQAPSQRPATGVADRPVPAQLPPATELVGRLAELAELDRLGGTEPNALRVAVIIGPAGIGKTALAIHWAHRAAGRFPDGQLYVNLRGFDPGGRAMPPLDAVRGFLDALGVPAERIPADLDVQVALYRSLLAGKRTLVVLDNARDPDQVRPLLPGTSTAMVVVTSRNQLTPLAAAEGAHPIALGLLSTVEARQLLVGRLGAERTAAEPDAVDAILTACARLPLALTIAAARAHQTGLPLGSTAEELADAGSRLDLLDAGDAASQIRAVFSWSVSALTPPAARLFRLLGLHPGPDFTQPAAASLAASPLTATHRLLTELIRANLLTEHAPGRYSFHDLLRDYATDLTASHDPAPERTAALTRLFDHYVHSAHAATLLMARVRSPITIPLGDVAPGTVVAEQADDQQAIAWIDTEYAVLLAMVRHAAETGFDTHAWQLVWSLDTYFERRSRWHDQALAWRTGLEAARRLDHAAAQAYAHCLLADADVERGRHDDGQRRLEHALDLYTRAGDLLGQANTNRDLAFLAWKQGQPQRALHHAERSRDLYEAAGERRGVGHAMNTVGWCHVELGNPAEAVTYLEQALATLREFDDRAGEAATLDSLAYAQHNLGNHATAADCYRQSIDLYRQIGDRYYQADTLTRLADTLQAIGDLGAARDAWRDALAILTELDHPDAESVRTKLDSVLLVPDPRIEDAVEDVRDQVADDHDEPGEQQDAQDRVPVPGGD